MHCAVCSLPKMPGQERKWVVFHCVYIPHLPNPSICQCTFGLARRSCCAAQETVSGHLWWSMIMWEKRMYTCMCNWVTMLYSRKLTEHCKPAIMEKKNHKNKKASEGKASLTLCFLRHVARATSIQRKGCLVLTFPKAIYGLKASLLWIIIHFSSTVCKWILLIEWKLQLFHYLVFENEILYKGYQSL